MGQGFYAVTDTDGTYAEGRRTGSVAGDVEACASGIRSDAQSVDAGSKHGCREVTMAAHGLGSEMYRHARTVAQEVESLDGATSSIGVTTQQSSNVGAGLQNGSTTLVRHVNLTNGAPIAV